MITNQGGISKGIFSQEQMEVFNEGLINKLRSLGANLDYIYFCPHHPEAHDTKMRKCSCRKPKPGLIDNALLELPILKERSSGVWNFRSREPWQRLIKCHRHACMIL